MNNKQTYTEADLDLLIMEKLDTAEECKGYPNVCQLMQTPVGKDRIFTRIKQVILNDGNTSIDSAIATVETELLFTTEND